MTTSTSLGRAAVRGLTSDERQLRRVLASSFIGSAIEWYDFMLYGTVAALVFPAIFFPASDPFISTLLSLSSFAVGFIARPIGGIVAGIIGDRIGRKSALVMTLMVAGVSTFAIGFVPSYEVLGMWAPLLLTLLRFAQGFGVGGEWGSAVLMATEHAPSNQRGRAGGWAQLGVPAGLLLSTVALVATRACMSEAAFVSYGWRIPFWFSAALIAVGLFIRLRVMESPVFLALRREKREARNPLWQVIRKHPREILLTVGLRSADNVGFFLPCTYAIAYGKQHVGYSSQAMEWSLLAAALGGLAVIPFFARLSDRVGRRPLYLAGSLVCAVFTFPFFWMMDSGNVVVAAAAIFIYFNLGHNMLYGPQAAWFAELFSAEVRSSGINLGTQISSILTGGLTPVIAAILIRYGGVTLVAAYVTLVCLVSVVCCRWTPETLNTTAGAR